LSHFGVSLGISAIPFVPVVSAVTFWVTFTYCFDEISKVWKLKDRSLLLKQRHTKRKFLEAIFDVNPYAFLALQAIDILGPTDAPATASVLAKVIAGITLIHDNLFVRELVQRRDGVMVTPLTTDDIDRTVKAFRTGPLRKAMRNHIDGSSLFTKAYSKHQISNLIQEAIEVARGKYPRESLERVQSSGFTQKVWNFEPAPWGVHERGGNGEWVSGNDLGLLSVEIFMLAIWNFP
jgi:hypothetical protein